MLSMLCKVDMKKHAKLDSRGSGDGQFINPQGLCFNSKGLLYVVDHSNYRVQVFRENVFLFKFGSKGHNPGQFQYPRYIAVDSSDQVYVTDYSDDGGISVFSEDGHFIKRVNCNSPFAIFIAPDDHIIALVNDVNSISLLCSAPPISVLVNLVCEVKKRRI